ncbi:MAG: gamma-glutamyltransferase [Candidatus Neomarinimicrobiota bacterium]
MKNIVKISLFSFLLISLINAQEIPNVSKNGMVVSASQLASQVGIDIMKTGGNAIDAAVATGFALAVTHPQAGNIGGGGFLVAHLVDGKDITIDFRETAPLAAHRDMYLDKNGDVIKNMSITSHGASGVPGSVAGLITAWSYYGSGIISLKQLLKPAIKIAKNGFKISQRFANSLNESRSLFEKDDGASEVFIHANGKPWQTDDLLIQKDLAKTLQRIAKYGIKGFYAGKTAKYIVKEMEAGNGLITLEDLNSYSPKLRAPIFGTYKNYNIVSMGPPSSGGILLLQMLNMLEFIDFDSLDFNSTDYIHLLTEIERRAYADRAKHLGDSDFWEVPIEMLISKKYAAERVQNISMQKATPSTEVFAGYPIAYESPETTHYSVIDKDGNAVSITTTINRSYGSGKLVDGAGFLLNNEMDDFSSKPGFYNSYGLIGNRANAISPNKRPLSSMTPTIVLNKDNKPFFIIGSPGGSTIITTVLQVILNIIEHDMTITEAVSAPRVHSQWLPDVIMSELETMPDSIQKDLEFRGHKIISRDDIGSANGILINKGMYYGGPDPRWENAVVGY